MRIAVVCAAFLSSLPLACTPGSTQGNLEAQELGSLDHSKAERRPPDVAHRSRCGRGDLRAAGAAVVARKPYVQSVSSTSAKVLWTTTVEHAHHLEVKTVQGEQVARVASETDPTARPPTGELRLAPVGGLEPDRMYCYRIVGPQSVLSEWAGFRTAPLADTDQKVRFAAFGDSGHGGTDQFAVREQLHTVALDLVIHTGDLAYVNGTRREIEQHYFGVYERLIQSFPVFPAAGNHDYATEGAAPFREAFALPTNASMAPERWYSFNWGPVHFVALDTQRIGPEQVEWLERDLASHDRAWTVVYGHHPPYSSGSHGSDAQMQEHFVPVFEDYGVDVVFSGHDHNYERTLAIDGVRYVVTGGGGRGTRGVGQSEFTAFSLPVAHFVYVSADPQQLTLHAIDASGDEFDQMRIRR
jgi:3',5'-cyclic AMP phosphodiesterase CpdA